MGELIWSGGRLQNDADDDDDSNTIMKGQGKIDQIDATISMMGVPWEYQMRHLGQGLLHYRIPG